MKYEYEITVVTRTKSDEKEGQWSCMSIDKVIDTSLTKVLAQFMIVLASLHTRILNDLKAEMRIIDDDIPF